MYWVTVRKKSCISNSMEKRDYFSVSYILVLQLWVKGNSSHNCRSQVTSWFLWQNFGWLTPYIFPTFISIVHLPETRNPHILFWLEVTKKMYFDPWPLLPTLNIAWYKIVVAILRPWDNRFDREPKDSTPNNIFEQQWQWQDHITLGVSAVKNNSNLFKSLSVAISVMVAEGIPNWHNVKAIHFWYLLRQYWWMESQCQYL